MEIAQTKAETEFDKFRKRQDIGYRSDFDRQLDWIKEQAKKDS